MKRRNVLAPRTAAAVWDLLVRREQSDLAVRVRKAKREHLSDLARRKVDDGRHLAADERFRLVVLDDLCAR